MQESKTEKCRDQIQLLLTDVFMVKTLMRLRLEIFWLSHFTIPCIIMRENSKSLLYKIRTWSWSIIKLSTQKQEATLRPVMRWTWGVDRPFSDEEGKVYKIPHTLFVSIVAIAQVLYLMKACDWNQLTNHQSGKWQLTIAFKAGCLERGELFVDEEFPPDDGSLWFSERQYGIEWKRPHELVEEPSLMEGGGDRFDVNQVSW